MATSDKTIESFRPPVQKRGKETVRRILNTVEALLEDQLFDEISISEILEGAKVSAGSFYARFESKDDILPVLLDEYEIKRTEYFEQQLSTPDWEQLTFQQTAYRLVSVVANFFRDNRGMIRAFLLFYRIRPELFSSKQKLTLDRIYKSGVDRLLKFRHEIRHPNPEKATKEIFALIVSSIRDKTLFESRPYSQGISHSSMIRQLGNAMHASLIHPPMA